MSGRKKNRKHRHGQPPNELLSELNSLRELLGSDMEADIPLLDQVAGPNQSEQPQSAPPVTKPQRAPLAAQRPLQEADLPILFSPVDEEPAEEYAPLLSDADRELLRPLQNLPRSTSPLTENKQTPAESNATQTENTSEEQSDIKKTNGASSREEFQPGLFDPQQKPAKPLPVTDEKAGNAEKIEVEPASAPDTPAIERKAQSERKPLPAAMSENPFLPPHIRARLTGGRIPRPEPDQASEAKPSIEEEPDTPSEPQNAQPADTGKEQETGPSDRERLIEQLMAEQLPELERQLRANITRMVNEIYPEELESE
ncbi:hypothetical protein [Microbulbifer sp. YPW1]|uniref:hypothetical protein n=1 Tax=Microbulbifer sp. YPW1 TaxID=2745199 RepID=UPI001599FC7A|nr:hypothetical protein [Microbulbifer sp. YPW1]QKX15601.1 hypothetical protein HUW35_00490 [Microbulbifer sp. YPW1]